MRRSNLVLLFACAAIFLMLPTARAQVEKNGKIGKIQRLLLALNSLDLKRIQGFVTDAYSPKALEKLSAADRAARLLAVAHKGAPFVLGDTVADKPDECIVRIHGSQALELEMKVDFDPDDHKIVSIRVGGPGSQSGPPSPEYKDWKDLGDLLGQVKAFAKVPAIGAAIVKDRVRQSAVVGERELGKPDKAQIGDRWIIGSITKSMTATMIARLVDQGVLKWDTTVGEALPDTPMRPEYKGVTLLQLLRHRSGIVQDLTVDGLFVLSVVGKETDRVKIRESYARNILGRSRPDLPDLSDSSHRSPNRQPPTANGSGPNASPGPFAYSNAGYALAAHMAEVVAKKPYEQLMQNLVFDPLEMKSARIGVPGAEGNPGAKGQLMGHYPAAAGLVPRVLDDAGLCAMFAPAGGGVSMSIDDLLRFADYHLQGMRGHVTLMKEENFKVLHDPVGDEKYACGWLVIEGVTAEPYQGHNGSDGTFRAEMAIWPEHNLAVVSIMNAGGENEPTAPLQVVIAAFNRYAK